MTGIPVLTASQFDPGVGRAELTLPDGLTLMQIVRQALPGATAVDMQRVRVALVTEAGSSIVEPALWHAVRPRPGVRVVLRGRSRLHGAEAAQPGLLEAAVRDEGFCQRLQLRAAVAAQPGLAQLRALLLPSVRWHGYSVYGDDDADALVGRIEDAVGMLEARISDGDPALIGLIEEVIGEAESAIAEIHDSDDLYTAIQALHSIHLRACIALRPDGEALGRELGAQGPRVLLLAPRATDTELNVGALEALNRQLGTAVDTPERVASELMQLLAGSSKQRFIGWPEKLFARVNALLPFMVDGAIARQWKVIRQFACQFSHQDQV